MSTFIDHLHMHLTHPRHLAHNVLWSLGVCGLLMAADQFYTGNYVSIAAGQLPENRITLLPEVDHSEDSLQLIPAINSVRGVCYIKGTDMWDAHNHRVCQTGEPVCRTVHGYIVGCETKKIIR